jgi:hypothetical protein
MFGPTTMVMVSVLVGETDEELVSLLEDVDSLTEPEDEIDGGPNSVAVNVTDSGEGVKPKVKMVNTSVLL